MSRKHASLEKDAELENAAWVATRGAIVGAAKVSHSYYVHTYPTTSNGADSNFFACSGDYFPQLQQVQLTSSPLYIED